MAQNKILILGNDRVGKDTLAGVWADHYGMLWRSSSMAALDIFMYDILQMVFGNKYRDKMEAFEDRVNHRQLWYQLISSYNYKDPTKLARKILQTADAYVGMRDPIEIQESIRQNLFDHIVLIDASERVEPNSLYSFEWVEPTMTIYNNGTLEEFIDTAVKAGKTIFK